MRWFERSADDRLVAYLDGTLSRSERAALERALKERSELQRQLAELRRDLRDLAALPLPWKDDDTESEARFRAELRRKLAAAGDRAKERTRGLRPWLWVALPGTAAAIVALLVVLDHPSPVDRPPIRNVSAPLPPPELGFESALAALSDEQLEQAATDLYAGLLPDDAAAYVESFAPSAEEQLLELDPETLDHTLSELEAAFDAAQRAAGRTT